MHQHPSSGNMKYSSIMDTVSRLPLVILQALARFDRQLPGFVTDAALLHGVETRTSCPVQIGTKFWLQSGYVAAAIHLPSVAESP